MPMELLKYQYRRLFKLTEAELQSEPADTFFTNLRIWGLIQEKEAMEAKHGARK